MVRIEGKDNGEVVMKYASKLDEALTIALNVTFPAVLRSRSWNHFEYLHQYATYEQWYNAELLMHFGQELQWAEFDGCWLRARGEAPIEGSHRKVDWAIVSANAKDGPSHRFTTKEVRAYGETKIIGLDRAGQGVRTEQGRLETLCDQLDCELSDSCHRYAYVVLPCWSRRKANLEATVQQAAEGQVLKPLGERLGITLAPRHLQVITWPFAQEETTTDRNTSSMWFALMQLILRSTDGQAWSPVEAPAQHQPGVYLDATEPCVVATV